MNNIKKIIIGGLFVGSMILAGAQAAFAVSTVGTVCTQSTSLNVRTLPSTSAKVLTSVSKGSQVSIKGDYYDYSTYKTWYYISTNKGSGFVSGDYICIY